MFFHASLLVSDKNIWAVWMHAGALHVWLSADLPVQDRTSKSFVCFARFISVNEEAESVLLGHSGYMRSEVTSKAG